MGEEFELCNLHILFYLGNNTLVLESNNQGRIVTSNPAAHGKGKFFDYSGPQKTNTDNINLLISLSLDAYGCTQAVIFMSIFKTIPNVCSKMASRDDKKSS